MLDVSTERPPPRLQFPIGNNAQRPIPVLSLHGSNDLKAPWKGAAEHKSLKIIKSNNMQSAKMCKALVEHVSVVLWRHGSCFGSFRFAGSGWQGSVLDAAVQWAKFNGCKDARPSNSCFVMRFMSRFEIRHGCIHQEAASFGHAYLSLSILLQYLTSGETCSCLLGVYCAWRSIVSIVTIVIIV